MALARLVENNDCGSDMAKALFGLNHHYYYLHFTNRQTDVYIIYRKTFASKSVNSWVISKKIIFR